MDFGASQLIRKIFSLVTYGGQVSYKTLKKKIQKSATDFGEFSYLIIDRRADTERLLLGLGVRGIFDY